MYRGGGTKKVSSVLRGRRVTEEVVAAERPREELEEWVQWEALLIGFEF